jgi:hypothetical protein
MKKKIYHYEETIISDDPEEDPLFQSFFNIDEQHAGNVTITFRDRYNRYEPSVMGIPDENLFQMAKSILKLKRFKHRISLKLE